MQFKTIIALALAAVASAQDLSKLPPCAAGPALSSIGSSGCAATNAKCICENKAFIASLQPAIAKSCTDPADLQKAIQFAVDFCKAAGVDLQIPGTGAPSSSAPAPAPASSSAAPSSAAQTSAAATSGYAAPSTSASAAPSSSAASNATSAVPTSAQPSQSIVPGAAANVGVKSGMLVLAGAAAAVFAL